MCRVKFVIVLLCLVSLVQSKPRPKKYYYSNPNDPNAIVFEGPTNYDTRKPSENEVLDDNTVGLLIDPRFGEIGAKNGVNTPPAPPPEPVDAGFYFPDD